MSTISQDLKDALAADIASMTAALNGAEVVDVSALQQQLADMTAERDALQAKIDAAIAALS